MFIPLQLTLFRILPLSAVNLPTFERERNIGASELLEGRLVYLVSPCIHIDPSCVAMQCNARRVPVDALVDTLLLR
jgi:hypothetical protein